MKKNNGQRKASGRRKKGRRKAPVPAPSKPARAPSTAQAKPSAPLLSATRKSAHARAPLISAFGRVDWPALAILVAPLALMALLQSHRPAPAPHVAVPQASQQSDLAREAEPLVPEPREHAALAPSTTPEPEPEPAAPIPIEGQPPQAAPAETASLAPPESEPAAPPPADHAEFASLPEPAVAEAEAPVPPADIVRLPPEAAPPLEPWHGDLAHATAAPIVEPENAHDGLPPPSLPSLAALAPSMCVTPEPSPSLTPTPRPASFGHAIAAAARAQSDEFVIYNARYMRMAYPGGDTQPLYGVCTDVLIRAYRAFGIDLQALVHTSRLGRGDPSIDHRRVEVVRRFLERHGTSLTISEFAEDYRPGDIVTYHRPGGRISQHHIAIVSDRIAPSGRPLIAHNRGWGTQLEDALFVDRITGHYRLSPQQVEAFERTRAPHVAGRGRRTADMTGTTRR